MSRSQVHPLTYLLTIPLAFTWPLVHLLIYFVRFGALPDGLLRKSLSFVPAGFAGAVALVYFSRQSDNPAQRVKVLLGYLLACPVALLGMLLGGLAMPPVFGSLLFGGLPLVLGSALGYALGGRR